jgi:tetratricopeptide (TPR) repeat protein
MAGDEEIAQPVADAQAASGIIAAVKRWFSQLDTLVKVAAGLTTLVGVGTAAYQGYSAWQEQAVRHRAVAAYVSEASSDLDAQDYSLSWDANAKALKLAPTDPAALAQQTRIAMAWLENVRLSSKSGATTFGDIANPLLDALAQRAASPMVHGVELANIKAHIGWARFLRSRDDVMGLRIAEEFDEAIKIDAGNMYGHVMRGFFILWQGGQPDDAKADFNAALQSDVDPPYRDRMILAALFNSHQDEYQLAAVYYANVIRKSGRPIDAGSRHRLLSLYEMGISDIEYLNRLARTIPFDEHIATLNLIAADQTEEHRQRTDIVLKAYFLELGGKNAEALALYQQVVAATPPQLAGRATDLARSGIRRLTRASGGTRGAAETHPGRPR